MGITHTTSPPKILSTCSISGLPLGFLPRARITVRAAIPFAQYTLEDMRAITRRAIEPDGSEDERKFAFCVALFNLPPQLLHVHALPHPDWALPQLANMIEPHGLRAFTYAVETIRSLPLRFYIPRENDDLSPCILAPYSVHSGYNSSTQNLASFPAHLNGWLRVLQQSKLEREAVVRKRTLEDARLAVRHAQDLYRTPRKQRNEILSIFDSRRSSEREILNYARQLAALLDVEPNRKWLNLVREPWFFHSYQLEQIMLDVRACASGEDEFLSAAHTLLYEFIAWLDAGITRAKAQELQARQVAEFVEIEEAAPLIAMDVANAAELLHAKFPNAPVPANTPPKPSHPLLAKARALLQAKP